MLSRDTDRPFSRELNIPIFFWNSIQKELFENDSPYLGMKNLVFPFVSATTFGHDDWKLFYKRCLRKRKMFQVIPISIDKNVFLLEETKENKNAIRVFEWERKSSACKTLLFDVAVAHAIYSFTYTKDGSSRRFHPLSLFLSHCKNGEKGERIAQIIKEYVQRETTIQPFFDKTAIMSGEVISSRIMNSIDISTIILIETDFYSTRHWCQREICRAKQSKRPIFAIDCREHFEDRVFPGCANVPCLHVRHDMLRLKPIESEKEVLRILEAALVETLRCCYNYSRLCTLQKTGVIQASAVILIRPPELSDLIVSSPKNTRKTLAYYPEPPVFQEESDWYPTELFEARTPLWKNKNNNEFRGINCGISVSVPDDEEFGEMLQIGHTPDSLHRLIQDISRHLLVRNTKLLFGGDLREKDKSGFTRFILDEAIALRERGIKNFPKIENHVAWSCVDDTQQLCHLKADYDTVLTLKQYDRPSVSNRLDRQFVQAMALSKMRNRLTLRSDVRICAGGKRFGFKGAMPGVLEEVLIALRMNKPLFLLGGFGGVVQDIVDAISRKKSPESLTEWWQLKQSARYDKMLCFLKQSGRPVCYADILDELQRCSMKNLAKRAGLSYIEYSRLIHSPFVDECLFLILRGIRNVKKQMKGNQS